MDYHYDKTNDLLTIKFPELLQHFEENNLNKTFPADLNAEIGLLFGQDGQLAGLEVSPASKYFAENKLARFAQTKESASEKQDADLQQLSKAQYASLGAPVLFEDPENDQFYGLLEHGAFKFKFAWIRELVAPVIKWLDHNICIIGIDKNFAVVNFQTGEVLLSLPLNTYFVDCYILENTILVITQLEIFKISTTTYEIVTTFDLPDFFVSIEILGDIFKVRCFDGSELSLS